MSNLKSLALAILELLVFNAQKFGGYVTLSTSFRKNFKASCPDCVPGNMLVKFEVRSSNRFGAICI